MSMHRLHREGRQVSFPRTRSLNRSQRRRQFFQPQVEQLEDRRLLAINVAVVQDIGSGNTSGFVATRDQLNDDTYFDFNATLVSSSQVDTLTELSNYDVVVVGNNGYAASDAFNNLTFQSALRSWVENQGGGVVMTGWGIYGNNDNTRTDIDAIVPVQLNFGYTLYDNPVIGLSGSHPITNGLGGSLSIYPAGGPGSLPVEVSNTGSIDASAVLLGSIAGRPAIVASDKGLGRGVYVGPIYSGTYYGAQGYGWPNLSLRSGPADRLLEQAVNWAASAPVDVTPPTVLSLTPSINGGTMPAGTTSVQVTYSETVVGGGNAAHFELRSQGNDGLLGTTDDSIIGLAASYSGTTSTLTFAGMADGVYRFTVRDTLADLSANALDGDGNGLAGGSYVRDFVVGPLTTTLSSPNGFSFDPETSGFGAGQLVQGTSNTFDGVNRLLVNGTDYSPNTPAPTPALTLQEYATTTSASLSGSFAPIPGLAAFTATSPGTYRISAVASVLGSSGYVGYGFYLNGVPIETRFFSASPTNPYNTVALEDTLTLNAGDIVDFRAYAVGGGFQFWNGSTQGSAILRVARFNDIPSGGPSVTLQEYATTTSASLSGSFAPIPGLAAFTATSPGTYRISAVASVLGSSGYVGYGFYVNGVPIETRFFSASPTNPYNTVALEDTLTLNAGDIVDFRVYAVGGGFQFWNGSTQGSAILRVARFNDIPSGGPSVTLQEYATTTSASLPGSFAPIPGLAAFTATSPGTYRISAVASVLGSSGYVGYGFYLNGVPIETRFFSASPTNPYNTVALEDTLTLNAGDIVDFRAYAVGGGFQFWNGSTQGSAILRVARFNDIAQASLVDGNRTLITPSQTLAGLAVHREITVPATGSEGFARTMDVFTNPTGSPITTTVKVVGNLGANAATTVFSTSSGDSVIETSDQWVGTDDADGTGTPAIVHYIHGPAGLSPSEVNVIGDNIYWTYEITVAPGDTVRLACFTILANMRSEAIAAANSLVTPTGFGGQAAAFLTGTELDSLTNFSFNQAPSVAANNAAVTANEGGTAVNTGTFSDPQGNSTTTLQASIGSISQDNDAGTWQWELNVIDGPVGPLTVTITATDSFGASTQSTFTYGIDNVAPSISLSGATTVNEGATYTLNLGVVTDPGTDTITDYSIDWGDGIVEDFTGNPVNTTKTHIYADGPANNTYNVSVTDEDGSFLAGSMAVEVLNVAPSVTTNGDVVINEGGTATNTGSWSDPGLDTVTLSASVGTVIRNDGGTWSWSFDTSDGPEESQLVTISAADSDNAQTTSSFWLTVNEVAPTVTITGNTTVNEGSIYTLNLSSTDPGNDTINQWEIQWGDGSDPDGDGLVGEIVAGNPSSVTHIYPDGPRTHTILATASDEDGTYSVSAGGNQAVLDPGFGDGGEKIQNFVDSTADYVRDTVIVQSDGKVLVAGYTAGGNYNIAMARYLSDGTLDATFGNGGRVITDYGSDEMAYSMVLDGAGNILIGASSGLSRYSPDGVLDTGFGVQGQLTSFGTAINKVVLEGDPHGDYKILIGGSNRLGRLTKNGTWDGSFGVNGKATTPSYFNDFTLDTDGKVVTTGYRSILDQNNKWQYDLVAERFNSNGSLDPTFGTAGRFTFNNTSPLNNDFRDFGQRVTIQQGKILIAGISYDYRYDPTYGYERTFSQDILLLRLNLNGTALDATFGSSGKVLFHGGGTYDSLYAVKIDASDRIVVSGEYGIYRFAADGAAETSLNNGAGRMYSSTSSRLALSFDSGGRVYVGGSRTIGAEGSNFAVERFNDDGTQDTTFGEGPYTNYVTTDFVGPTADYLTHLTISQPDGKILVAGYKSGGTQDIVLARYLPTGQLDTTFGSNGSGLTTTDFSGGYESATALAVSSDGKIYVGYSAYVVRYDSNGILDTAFGSSGRFYLNNLYVQSLVFATDGKLVVAGYKYQSQGSGFQLNADFAVARYIPSTHTLTADTSFSSDGVFTLDRNSSTTVQSNQLLYDMKLDGFNRVVAVGYTYDYDTVNRQSTNYNAAILRLDTNGELDPNFGSAGNGLILTTGEYTGDTARKVVLDNSGRIVVGFNRYLHRYDSDGVLDSTFSGNGVIENFYNVSSLRTDAQDRILAGGSGYLMRWTDNGSPDSDFAPNGRITTPANRYINAIEVDNANRIVVAGYVAGQRATGVDYWLARYITEGLAVTVNNVAPQQLAISGPGSTPAPTTASEGDTISLVASATDPAGPFDPLTYSWNITRNGSEYLQISGPSISFDVLDGGTYRVTVTVNDGDGGTASTYKEIVVANVAPTATYNYPSAVNEGSEITLSLSSPFDPSSVDTAAGFTYAFNFGDGYGPFSSGSSAVFTPPDNSNRTVRAKIRDKDGGVTEYTSTVVVNNVAPTGIGDEYVVAEDHTLSVAAPGVLNNDTDPGLVDTLTAVLVANPSHGTVTIMPDGSCTYVPNPDFSGSDAFQYKAVDKDGGESDATTVTVTVTEVNDAPTANADAATVAEDGSVTIAVLANDVTGPDNESSQTLTVTAASALHGTVTINDDGTLTYTPDADYNGPDTISYTITDNGTTNGVTDPLTDSSTVAVTVTEVNDAPTANADTATVAEDGSVMINVLTNDVAGPANEGSQTLTVTAASALHGTVTIDGNGTLTYTPDTDYNGADTISYTLTDNGTTNGVTDPLTDSSTVAVTVTKVNDAPTANADAATVAEDGSVMINVLTNDVAGPANEGSQTLTVTAASALHGTVTINDDGTLTYAPDADYNGADTISYTITDNGTTNGVTDPLTDSSTVTVTVTEVNDAPTANADAATVAEDGSVMINVLTNDVVGPANEGSQTLTVTAASALHGTVTIDGNGTLTYTPDTDYNGADTISYTLTDNGTTNGVTDPLTDSSTVAVTVTEVNDAPTANADTATVAEDGSVTIAVLANDVTGPDNESSQTLTVTAASALHGTVTINDDGTLTYAPDADYNGADTISYTLTDNGTTNGASDPLTASSTVTVTVTEVNDAPTANADTATVAEDGSVTIAVLANDVTGPDNESSQTLTVTAASALHGTVTIDGNGTLTYTPDTDYNGPDTISYTITDNGTTNGVTDPLTDSSTVTVTVTEVNDAPTANADTATVAEDGSVTIAVLANDVTGPDNESSQTLTVTAASALHGTVTIDGNGTLTYTPDTDYNGADTISYTLTDNGTTNGVTDPLTDSSTVAVTVTEVNDAPTANADTATVAEDGSVMINVLTNDVVGPANEGSQTLTVTAASALHGTVTIDGNGTLTYTPDTDYNGPDTISYTLTDNGTTNGVTDPLTDSSTVAVTVTEVNDAPTANADAATVAEDGSVMINVLTNDVVGPANEGSQTLTVTAASALHGTVTIDGNGTLTYAPDADYNGADTISYTLTDNGTTNGASDPLTASSTVTVTVTEVNDAPTANADTATVAEDGSVMINVLTNDVAGPANEGSQTLTVTAASALHGTVTIDGNGTLTYTPDADYNGPDTISYTITDNGTTNGADDPLTASSTVTVTVTEVNDAPTANADAATVAEDGSVMINVLTNDVAGPANEGSQTLTVTAASALYGTVTIDGNGTLTYTPDTDYNGPDTISYTITDNGTTNGVTDPLTDSSTVTVTVTAVNDAPIAVGASLITDEDAPQEIDLRTLVQDLETSDNDLAFSVGNAIHGSVSLLSDGFTARFVPALNYDGPASFTYSVTDTGDPAGTPENAIAVTDVAINLTVRNLVDLSGRVFDDRDNDGRFDDADGDIGIDGITMQLIDELIGLVAATSVTSGGGDYNFPNISTGTYSVRQQAQPTGYLDGLESTGDLGGELAGNGSTVNNTDSNIITGIAVGAAGTQLDAGGFDFAELLPSSLQGLAWEDFNNNTEVDLGEIAIANVIVTLTGTDDRGTVSISQTTDLQGIFEFVDLRPGSYVITQSQPTGFVDGQEVVGQLNLVAPGVVSGDQGVADPDTNDGMGAVVSSSFSQIDLVPGAAGVNYNFGDRIDGGTLGSGQTATIGFWQNKHGQSLIRSLNGNAESTILGGWLAATFPNMYGNGILDVNHDGQVSNAEVAQTYQMLFKRTAKTSPGGPPKLDAQVMAVALATFITKESYAGLVYDASSSTGFAFNDVDGDEVCDPEDVAIIDQSLIGTVSSYGFSVTVGGVGSAWFNVGDSGEAFGVADNTNVQIIDLLLATNAMSHDGLLYDGDDDGQISSWESLLRTLANDVYSRINERGGR